MMKKLLFAAALLASLPASAQTRPNAIKLNTTSLVLQTASVFYERALADNRSLNLGLLAANFSSGSGDVQLKSRGFAVTGEYRFYPAGRALRGWFVGPYLRFQRYNFTNINTFAFGGSTRVVADKSRLTTFGGGGVAGWKGQFGSRFSLEPYLGLGYAAGKFDDLDDDNGSFDIRAGIRGFEVRPGLSVGYLFGAAK